MIIKKVNVEELFKLAIRLQHHENPRALKFISAVIFYESRGDIPELESEVTTDPDLLDAQRTPCSPSNWYRVKWKGVGQFVVKNDKELLLLQEKVKDAFKCETNVSLPIEHRRFLRFIRSLLRAEKIERESARQMYLIEYLGLTQRQYEEFGEALRPTGLI